MRTLSEPKEENISIDLLYIKKYSKIWFLLKCFILSKRLYAAMCSISTYEDEIISVFRKINSRDCLLMIIIIFGYRLYGSEYIGYRPLSLTEWLQEELSGSDLDFVRGIFLKFDMPFQRAGSGQTNYRRNCWQENF
jgi:hypothetical protein